MDDTFEPKVRAFLAAIAQAGIATDLHGVLRPVERAYMMHWSYLIAKGQATPQSATPMPGVNICWVHYTADGQPDNAASVTAARSMAGALDLNLKKLMIPPALTSNHTRGLAVDFKASWSAASVTINQADGTSTVINTAPHNEVNRQLIAVGATYGVIHLSPAWKDPAHWSYNGI